MAYYPFNGDAKDESGNGYDGAVNGATLTADRFGNADSSYSIDGLDDYIDISALAPAISGRGTGTISFWFKTNSSNYSCLMMSWNDGVYDNWNHGFINLGYVGAGFYASSIGYLSQRGKIQMAYQNGTSYYYDDAWHHVAIVVGENYNSLYVDGQNLQPDYYYSSSPAVGNVMGDNVASISVGLRLIGTASPFVGAIDDIRFYDRPLSDVEISQLYLIGN